MGPGHAGYGGYGGHGAQGNYAGHRDSRRRPQSHYMQPTYHNAAPPMYNGYGMNPYGNQFYQQLPPHYQNGMPSGYMHYQQPYGMQRSPPMQQQYVPMAGVTVPQYPQHHQQQSPALATPYQPPPIPNAIHPQTPTSTHSSQVAVDIPNVSSQSSFLQQPEQAPPSVQAPATPQSSVMSAQQPIEPTEPEEPKEPFRAPVCTFAIEEALSSILTKP